MLKSQVKNYETCMKLVKKKKKGKKRKKERQIDMEILKCHNVFFKCTLILSILDKAQPNIDQFKKI